MVLLEQEDYESQSFVSTIVDFLANYYKGTNFILKCRLIVLLGKMNTWKPTKIRESQQVDWVPSHNKI